MKHKSYALKNIGLPHLLLMDEYTLEVFDCTVLPCHRERECLDMLMQEGFFIIIIFVLKDGFENYLKKHTS